MATYTHMILVLKMNASGQWSTYSQHGATPLATTASWQHWIEAVNELGRQGWEMTGQVGTPSMSGFGSGQKLGVEVNTMTVYLVLRG